MGILQRERSYKFLTLWQRFACLAIVILVQFMDIPKAAHSTVIKYLLRLGLGVEIAAIVGITATDKEQGRGRGG